MVTRFSRSLTLWLAVFSAILLGTSPVTAQAGDTYVDPSGRFTVPIPSGWSDKSTDQFANFVNPEGTVNFYALGVDGTVVDSGILSALKTLDPAFDAEPVQNVEARLTNALWKQHIYVVGTDIIAALGTVQGDVTIVGVMRGTQAAVQAANNTFLQFLMGMTFGIQKPVGPYVNPDAFTEIDVTVQDDVWALPGTLSMPKGDGPFPAVVLVHGSGPNDRDETIAANKPFQDIAWGLASKGIAVLRYDKRTYVYGERAYTDPQALTVQDEVIDDALAAIKLLRETDGIDPDRVFVLGHSLGGMLTPRIGAADSDLAGLIILAGLTRLLEDVTVEQVQYLAEMDGVVSSAEQAQIDAVKATADKIKALKSPSDTTEYLMGAPASYWLDLKAYDPVATADTLTMPMLILQGERDYQVTMVDFDNWKAGLSSHGNVTFKSYPALDHLFLAGEGAPNPDEYYVPGYMAEEVIDDIAAWIVGT